MILLISLDKLNFKQNKTKNEIEKETKKKWRSAKAKICKQKFLFMPSVSHPSYVKIQETINNEQKEEENNQFQ